LAYRHRTPRGEVRVEDLSIGETAITAYGEVRPTRIGTGRVPAIRGQRSAATPVIIGKGALVDNVPHADLQVDCSSMAR
jgi:hypothetical protein